MGHTPISNDIRKLRFLQGEMTQKELADSGDRYDIVFDTVGKAAFGDCVRAAKQDGIYLTSAAGLRHMLGRLWLSLTRPLTSGKQLIAETADHTVEDLEFLRDLVEAGEVKSVIDRCYPLEEIADAHHYVQKGHKKGNVVIPVAAAA